MDYPVFIRVVRKVGTGVKEHFRIRVSEWVMALPLVGMYLALQIQPDMFSKSGSFSTLAAWGNENTWALLCLFCGITRILALIVNGSFEVFPYSPHIRMTASLLSLFFWSQYSLGFIDAYMNGVGAFSAVIAYTTFAVFELVNFWRSNLDRLTSPR